MSIDDIKGILKNRRIELGLTMADVAKAVGVSEATVSRWESGNIANMKRSRIAALAKVLRISPTVIMGYDSSILDDIPLALLEHYQEQGMSEIDMIKAYTVFRETELKDMASDYKTLSQEAMEIAEAYDTAKIDKQNIVRLTLGLKLKQPKIAELPKKKETPDYLQPVAAHLDGELTDEIKDFIDKF